MKYCPHCGSSVDGNPAFCSSCGKSLAGSQRPGGFWKGVVAAVVGVGVAVGILWATMGSNSADRRAPAASETETARESRNDVAPAPSAGKEAPNVVVEEPGFFGKLTGEKPHLVLTVAEGTSLALELRTPLSTETARAGDTFEAVLPAPVRVEDHEALPKGTLVTGHVAHAKRSDKVKGRAELTLELDSVVGPDEKVIAVETEPLHFEARSTRKKDAAKIGGAGGVGAIVGAIVGGKKGAAIGAGAGAGAGTGVVLATRGEEVVLAEGTPLRATLRRSVTVEIPQTDDE